MRERVNPANERALILWSGACPLNWFYWGERWETKGVRKGSTILKLSTKMLPPFDCLTAPPAGPSVDFVCLNSGLGISSFNGIIQRENAIRETYSLHPHPIPT